MSKTSGLKFCYKKNHLFCQVKDYCFLKKTKNQYIFILTNKSDKVNLTRSFMFGKYLFYILKF
jgi:hypothetical protein